MHILTSILRKKLALAVLAAAVVGSAAYAFAATLGVTSNNLQAGNTTVASCQSANLTSSFTTSYSATAGKYIVSHVKISGIDVGCVGQTLQVQLTKADGTALGTEISHVIASGDETSGVDTTVTSQAIPAADVDSVNASIASA